MVFSTVPAITPRVIEMVNCTTVSDQGTKFFVGLTVAGPTGTQV
jgi:hypothetical protein